MKIPEKNAIQISEEVPFSWGSIIGCAVSTAYHGVKRADISNGDKVLVFGIGGVGLHAILWANFFGASEVIAVDPISAKHEAGRAYGADLVLSPQHDNVRDAVDDVTDGYGVDAVIECSGSPKAMEQAFDAVTGKNKHETGTVVSIGAQYEPLQTDYWGMREGWFTVSGDHTASDLLEIINLVETGKVNLSESISHTFELDEIESGLDVLQNDDDVRRVVIDI